MDNTKELKETLEKMERKFKSANSIDVERATITKDEWENIKKLINLNKK
jgi:lipoate-protein ligase A